MANKAWCFSIAGMFLVAPVFCVFFAAQKLFEQSILYKMLHKVNSMSHMDWRSVEKIVSIVRTAADYRWENIILGVQKDVIKSLWREMNPWNITWIFNEMIAIINNSAGLKASWDNPIIKFK